MSLTEESNREKLKYFRSCDLWWVWSFQDIPPFDSGHRGPWSGPALYKTLHITNTQKNKFAKGCMAMTACHLGLGIQLWPETLSIYPGNQHLSGPREMLFCISCAVSLRQKAIVSECHEGLGLILLLMFEMDTALEYRIWVMEKNFLAKKWKTS